MSYSTKQGIGNFFFQKIAKHPPPPPNKDGGIIIPIGTGSDPTKSACFMLEGSRPWRAEFITAFFTNVPAQEEEALSPDPGVSPQPRVRDERLDADVAVSQSFFFVSIE